MFFSVTLFTSLFTRTRHTKLSKAIKAYKTQDYQPSLFDTILRLRGATTSSCANKIHLKKPVGGT
jgi:hypothetical protein